MTNTSATIASLATLTMDMVVHPVVDELAALSRLRPTAPTEEESYALLTHQTPSLASVAARGRHHAAEAERFLACAARTRELALVHQSLPSLLALTLLNHGATIALALLPSTDPDDDGARTAACQAVVEAALANGHKEEVPIIRAAFGLGALGCSSAAELPQVMEDIAACMSDGEGSVAAAASIADGMPALHTIEQAATLSAFMTGRQDLRGLLAEARGHLDQADRFASQLDDGELPFAERDRLQRAQAGASLLGVATLARIGLAPVRGDDSRRIRIEARALIKERRLPDRLEAIVTLAGCMGRKVREQIGAFESHGGQL